ncbi:hypothetical protein [Leifsonia sp. SIMBA_070]|uniref:arsenate reductase/protein-tyrosine-phosphatase family protein n=1 Tax=Leifsonia sp. SIMBA_070 TaxID=3085810 RepID=UPI00397A411F
MPVILVVCTANVCRSPLAAAILTVGLRSAYPGSLTVLSAGIVAANDEDVCSAASRVLAGRRVPTHLAERSRAGMLDVGLVETADLIFTADISQRAAVAQLSSAARSRTFTLREAAFLLQGAARHGEFRTEPATFADAVDRLNTMRASIVMPASGRGRRFGGSGKRRNSLDISDGHGMGPKSHSDVVHSVAAVSETLSRMLLEGGLVPA